MPVPVLLGREATFQTARRLYNMYGKIEPGDQKKIATALGIFEENVNTEELRGHLNARKSSKVTPQMFEYALIEKAKKHRQHIVLPEGNDERILFGVVLKLFVVLRSCPDGNDNTQYTLGAAWRPSGL